MLTLDIEVTIIKRDLNVDIKNSNKDETEFKTIDHNICPKRMFNRWLVSIAGRNDE